MSTTQHDDEKLLNELGYKQELHRSWSGFSNFAISFSIISILSGCFTTFGQAWNNGGPIVIAWGWPIISLLILVIGLCMSELVSAMPTAGGIYYWAVRLGRPIHGWLTGWLNLIGLVAVTAGVDYGFATFFSVLANQYTNSINPGNLKQVFVIFAITLILHVLINIWGAKVIHSLQGINVWVHVFGVAVIIAILAFVPKAHQTVKWVFTHQINNSGFSSHAFWWYVLPLGFLLTQYTITGFDASAHVSEETNSASTSAAKGMWQSIAFSAVGGYILLLAFLFAATNEGAITKAGGFSPVIFLTSMSKSWAAVILLISCVGQFFCGMSCVTAASRMMFAFSRDGAVPGHKTWVKLDKNRNPSNSAIGVAIGAFVLTLPALYAPKGSPGVPVAFFAVTSISVIGLFVAFAIPIYLRWKMGDEFKQGAWNLGKKWKWMAPVAIIEIFIISIYFMMPLSPNGVPGAKSFTWTAVQYSPIVMFLVMGGATIWWFAGAKKHFHIGSHK